MTLCSMEEAEADEFVQHVVVGAYNSVTHSSLGIPAVYDAPCHTAGDCQCCAVCLAAPKNTLMLPCKHMTMCADCTRKVLASSSRPRCPLCRYRITDCLYGVFL